MSLLESQPRLVAVGAQMFADAVAAQAAPVQQVDWRPPLGDEGIEADLARVLADPRHADANQTAVARLLAAGAELVDVRPASEALALEKGSFLHAVPADRRSRVRARGCRGGSCGRSRVPDRAGRRRR